MTTPLDPQSIDAIVFDFGNTLIEFTASQLERFDAAVAAVLERHYGHVDVQRLGDLHHEARRHPYQGEYLESDLTEMMFTMVRGLYGQPPPAHLIDELLAVRLSVFVELIEAPHYLHELLERLRRRYRLALVSNFPCARSIRLSLDRIGITGHFDAIVVSAEVGRVKPHPLLFETVTRRLNVSAGRCLFVGDNWLGDVQGAKRAGMKAAHIVQFETPEVFDRLPGDVDPDVVIEHLTDLAGLLGVAGLPHLAPGESPGAK